ncbi:uncharacterized protein LOC126849333 [Cataglyphis hispanica]|uniref:uncharacterized protein LOC126849333 n=1 Tax=Cataglyphis hispanica TaxID=1086592 RepID=UPI00217F7639|nr:uncharacterized protein LOC126849333 [Cataglyphis hispanica]
MALTISSHFVIQGIGCTWTMLLVLSVQAINYEDHRHDIIPTKLNSNIILTNRDLLEQLNLVAPKANYTLQEGTERLLYFGALLRARILDTFGNLLYIYYDDFSIKEVEALHKIYLEIFERRYDIFNLVPAVLKNPDTRPSKICAIIYIYAKPCLKSSANICRTIRKQHDLPHPDNLTTPALNVTYLAYRLSKISRHYLRGFSLAALLKLLQREVLMITPDLLSGLLYNVRYDHFDDNIRLAERELVQSFHNITQTTKIPMLPTTVLKKFRTVNSFLKYYIGMYAERSLNDDLKRHAFLIRKRIDDVGMINENINLLGNVYENRTIHIKYLFDLVLPDDLLDNDVIEAKEYLVNKLNEFDVVGKYLKVQKYQQATPAQLVMEITGQLKDIDFAKSIAISLRMHAGFWRSYRMIESLDELLELFDAYENLRQVPYFDKMMQKIDNIRKNLWNMKDVPVEILCYSPRACLRIGLQSILNCKYVSSEIKELIKDFFKLSDMCVIPLNLTQETSVRRSVDIPFKIAKKRFSMQLPNISSESIESSESEEIAESDEISNESTESTEVLTESETSSEESTKFINTMTTLRTTEYIEPISTTTIMNKISTFQEETTAAMISLPTTTVLPVTTTVSSTTTTVLPTTTTVSPTTTTVSPTTIVSPTTTTVSPMTTTVLPTTTTTSPTTSTTSPITTIVPTTITTTLPTTTTSTLSTLITTISATTELPIVNIEMELERSKMININNLHDDYEITPTSTSATTSTSTRFCESNECSSEQSSEEISDETTTQDSTFKLIQTTSPESLTTDQDFAMTEMTTSSTMELNETPVTKEGCRSKSESIEISCETNCVSEAGDCDGEDSALKDISDKAENHTVKCSKVRCKEDSPEISSECDTEIDKSCDCISKEEESAECMTSCVSNVESSSCEERQNDCSKSDVPTVNMKFEHTQTRGVCEIRDPHHQRQMKRLAKMRAISAAMSHADVFRSKASRHRIASKKLYNLLATKLFHAKDESSERLAEYLLKRPLSGNRIEDASQKHRKKQEQIYRLRTRLAKKLNRKLTERTSMHQLTPLHQNQIVKISSRGAKSINATTQK